MVLSLRQQSAVYTEPLPDGDARYRHLMEQAVDGIFLLDEQFRVAEVNRAAEMMMGYAHREMLGHPVTDFIVPEELAAEPPHLDDLRRGGVIRRERTMVRQDGKHVRVEVHTRRIAPGYYFGIARDLTDRNLLEARVRQAEKLEAIGLLAGGVAHDFNNLLTVILGHCELLADAVRANSEAAQDAKAIQQAASRASALTAQLLAFGRRQVLQPEVFDVNVLISDLLPMLCRLVGEDVLISPELIPAPALVRLDRTQFEQILINLCANARDAMPHGGAIGLHTSIIACPLGRHNHRDIVIEVVDTGHGMSELTRARIFEPFFSTKAVGSGTGLGLAIVHGVVSQSGGHIECDSTPGIGTTFRMLFAEASGVPPGRSLGRSLGRRTEGPSRGCETILIVDDDEFVVQVLTRVLGHLGYLVISARSVADARALAEDIAPPALALADLVLPDGTGDALARELRARWPALTTLFMTGHTQQELERRDVDVEGWSVLTKPFDPAELAEGVRAALDKAGARAT